MTANTTNSPMPDGFVITGPKVSGLEEILTPEAAGFLVSLERCFGRRRRALLRARDERAQQIVDGQQPAFLEHTRKVREGEWKVAEAPADLQCRWAEITGPVDRKMMINALNSGAKVFMADIEDSLSPTWKNVIAGQVNLRDAVRGTIELIDESRGKEYRLGETVATLLVRPRGWHLEEKHVLVDGESISASLFDFGLYFFHNAQETLQRGTGPYFYLPKLESHLEARLWNDVFLFSQEALSVSRGSIRATVLIETILASFEMEEILYELREHSSGLNAGRWDYIFSAIKKFAFREDLVLPDRSQISMTVPFMRAYTDLLVRSCHKRGAHAIGGMAAFIPSRRDEEVNRMAMEKVREDKEREAADGFDGSWVAHPDLVSLCLGIFEDQMQGAAHQKQQLREDVAVTPGELVDLTVPGGSLDEHGIRTNISVSLQYLDQWFAGNGAVAINNLMEDAATAEIARAQLWQWVHRGAQTSDGTVVTRELYQRLREDEVRRLGGRGERRFGEALELLDRLVLSDEFEEFLTLGAYQGL